MNVNKQSGPRPDPHLDQRITLKGLGIIGCIIAIVAGILRFVFLNPPEKLQGEPSATLTIHADLAYCQDEETVEVRVYRPGGQNSLYQYWYGNQDIAKETIHLTRVQPKKTIRLKLDGKKGNVKIEMKATSQLRISHARMAGDGSAAESGRAIDGDESFTLVRTVDRLTVPSQTTTIAYKLHLEKRESVEKVIADPFALIEISSSIPSSQIGNGSISDETEAAKLLSAAHAAVDREDYESARSYLVEVNDKYPNTSAGRTAKGLLAQVTGKLAEAKKKADQLDAARMLIEVQKLFSGKEFLKADKAAKQLIEKYPMHSQASDAKKLLEQCASQIQAVLRESLEKEALILRNTIVAAMAEQNFREAQRVWMELDVPKFRATAVWKEVALWKDRIEKGVEEIAAKEKKEAEVQAALLMQRKLEETAQLELSLIKPLFAQGKTEIAKSRLSALINKYPSTNAAEEAQQLLRRLR